MYFIKIMLKNFGIYLGSHCLELERGTNQRNVTLIGGLNGRGKTTLLEAVFLALYGRRAIPFLQDSRMSYDEFLRRHINKSAWDNEASVGLTMVLDGSDESTVSVTRNWSEKGRSIAEKLTVVKNGRPDKYLAQGWDYYVEKILPLGIARFFFFDSEKITSMADDDADAEVKESIKSLTGVQTVEQLIRDVEKLADRMRVTLDAGEAACTAEEESASLSAEHDKITSDILKVSQQVAQVRQEIERTARQLENAENAFWKSGGQLGIKKEQIEADKAETEEQLRTLRQQALDIACLPATPLLLCQSLLERTCDRIAKEEVSRAVRYSASLLRQLRERLLSHVSELLDNPEQKSAVEERIEKEFTSLFAKESSDELLPISPATQRALESLLAQAEGFRARVRSLLNGINDCNTRLAELELHLGNATDNNEPSTLLQEIQVRNQELGALRSRLANMLEQQRALEARLEQIESKRRQLMAELATQEQLLDDRARIIKYASLTTEVMTEFKRRLQQERVKALQSQILACFRFLAQKETVITDIQIDPHTLNITLFDYQGGQLEKSQLSSGEKQIFAIAMLWGLARSSGYRLPVIIDTPLGRLDSQHRINLINRYLPHASEQVIVLSTDEEITGHYYELLAPYLNRTYMIVYNEEQKCSSIISGYFGGDQA